jgi:hypothetical protein
VKFVGHLAGSGQKRPDPAKLHAIREIAVPTNQKQLRSVLGLFGFYRPFVPHFSDLAKPLTDLTSKKAPYTLVWTQREQHAFEQLKEKLCEATSLFVPKIGRLFIIRTDASGVAVSECLSQKTDDDVTVDENGLGEYPVAFYSQTLTEAQLLCTAVYRSLLSLYTRKLAHYSTWQRRTLSLSNELLYNYKSELRRYFHYKQLSWL